MNKVTSLALTALLLAPLAARAGQEMTSAGQFQPFLSAADFPMIGKLES
jgi:hypothetical protein